MRNSDSLRVRHSIHLCSWPWLNFRMIPCFSRSKCFPFICFYHHLMKNKSKFIGLNQLSIELLYFVSVSFLGFLVLRSLKPRTAFRPRNLDLFFTSVSATTASSMSTVEMEVFSNTQLIVMIILMFMGGEVFTSMVGLHIRCLKLGKAWKSLARVASTSCCLSRPSPSSTADRIELGIITMPNSSSIQTQKQNQISSLHSDQQLKVNSIKFLGFVVLGYLLLIHFFGIISVLRYTNFVSSAKDVLRNKGLKQFTFAIFATVSTFANCGFVPTNENMMVFRKDSLLLLILIPQVLLGNTLFPSCLRFSIWFLGKFFKKVESEYLLQNPEETGYFHLLPRRHSLFLPISVLGFITIQFVLFCSLEWNSATLSGMNSIEKAVGVLFQTTNARHTGEGIVDLSSIAPAMLVLFVVMMYLPPYTSFLPVKDEEQNPQGGQKKKKRRLMENLIFSQPTYLAMFIILICITERKRLKADPLNFNLLNITVEVISAYANVGFSTGYSCERLLKPDPTCVDKWYGFAGKWSHEAKLILIVVMFFGKFKNFNMDGGKAWKLL